MTPAYDFSEHTTGTDLPRSDNRQRLLEAIADLVVEGAAPEDIDTLAIRLSTRFPQSGLTIDEICRRIGQALSGEAPDEHSGR